MPIIFHSKTQTFHLYNDEISYVIKILRNQQLGQVYYGKRISDKESFEHLLEYRYRPLASYLYEGDEEFSIEHLKQEYPSYGHGDLHYPAFEILQKNGSRITHFEYLNHVISPGKPVLKGLPAVYSEDANEATTLEITLRDSLIKTDIVLQYTLFEQYPVLTRSALFRHFGEDRITLETALSMCVDLPDKEYEMLELAGAWARERYIKNRALEYGLQSIFSLRGCSSANFNPFFALKRPNTDEFQGEVYGFSLVYSGNFLGQVEVDTYDVTRVTMGIHPSGFNWELKTGEFFQTPEVVLVYSDNGLNKMSQNYHELFRKRLARGYWRDRSRPILINNWEATYFDFDEERILQIAKTAKELGIELFVLDDGWFGTRNDDTQALGDWYVNREKLPNGIKGLANKIVDLGMKFGLWFEPEMVNKNSELYGKHPDWVLNTPGRYLSHGRNQYVLDFSSQEVIDYIYNCMRAILKEAPISYVKWDMNRSMSEVYSLNTDSENQGQVMHRYILGVYELYDRLTMEFPEILFESCASGGARFDPGMLYYAPQVWTSDNTDAVERQKIQYGTSVVYPLSSMGAHVAAVPNHQVLRETPLETRANVAYFGVFGYELDPNKLSAVEREKIKLQIEFVKKYRQLIHTGRFYRLLSPFEGNITAWMVVSEDQKEAIVGYYRILNEVNVGYRRLKLKGLNPKYCYHVLEKGISCCGDELMYAGLVTSDGSSGRSVREYDEITGDYFSKIYILKAIED